MGGGRGRIGLSGGPPPPTAGTSDEGWVMLNLKGWGWGGDGDARDTCAASIMRWGGVGLRKVRHPRNISMRSDGPSMRIMPIPPHLHIGAKKARPTETLGLHIDGTMAGDRGRPTVSHSAGWPIRTRLSQLEATPRPRHYCGHASPYAAPGPTRSWPWICWLRTTESRATILPPLMSPLSPEVMPATRTPLPRACCSRKMR